MSRQISDLTLPGERTAVFEDPDGVAGEGRALVSLSSKTATSERQRNALFVACPASGLEFLPVREVDRAVQPLEEPLAQPLLHTECGCGTLASRFGELDEQLEEALVLVLMHKPLLVASREVAVWIVEGANTGSEDVEVEDILPVDDRKRRGQLFKVANQRKQAAVLGNSHSSDVLLSLGNARSWRDCLLCK